MSLLWGVEKAAFPQARYFVGSGRVLSFFYFPAPSRVLEVLGSFFSHTVVMPVIEPVEKAPLQRVMTVQASFPGSGSAAGYIAAAAWLILLGLGVWASVSAVRRSRTVLLVLLTATAQLALHLVFGRETFLYSMHFLPLLIVIAAWVTFTCFRIPGLGLAAIVTVGTVINNNWQFVRAAEFLHQMAQIAAAYHK